MSEEREKRDVPEGFDLPGGEPTPPPEGPASSGPVEAPADLASGRPPAKEQKLPSVIGKFIALVVIPVIAIPILIYVYIERTKPLTEYQQQCVATARDFLKGLSDDTADSVPAARDLLSPNLKDRIPTERITGDYAEVAAPLGKFKDLGREKWIGTSDGEASRAFESQAAFEKGKLPVYFHFMRVMTDNGPRVLIDRYRLATKSPEE